MFNMVRSRAAARGKIRVYRGGMPGLTTNGLSKTSGGPKPEDDKHLKRVEAVSRENARLANENPHDARAGRRDQQAVDVRARPNGKPQSKA
jgi:hypothetical protein